LDGDISSPRPWPPTGKCPMIVAKLDPLRISEANLQPS
jgi:hypothetical protein